MQKYSTVYCPDCGEPSPSDPCATCQEIVAVLSLMDADHPSDKELEAMAAYYDKQAEQGRIDAHDDRDHDHIE